MKALQKAPDERLLIEAAQKDPRRFAELYECNFDRVYAFIARRVADRDEAEDLTSEVFHRALKNLARFQWRGAPFGAWLMRIATNAVNDHWHRGSKERALPRPDDPEQPSSEEVEHRARLFRMVNDLPAEQRRVVIMRFAEQKSVRDIAREMRRTEGAVKQLQFRALKNLRARMGDRDG